MIFENLYKGDLSYCYRNNFDIWNKLIFSPSFSCPFFSSLSFPLLLWLFHSILRKVISKYCSLVFSHPFCILLRRVIDANNNKFTANPIILFLYNILSVMVVPNSKKIFQHSAILQPSLQTRKKVGNADHQHILFEGGVRGKLINAESLSRRKGPVGRGCYGKLRLESYSNCRLELSFLDSRTSISHSRRNLGLEKDLLLMYRPPILGYNKSEA